MASLKNIAELPVAESAEGLNLIVHDNGVAKQIPVDMVGSSKTNSADKTVVIDYGKPVHIPVPGEVEVVSGDVTYEDGNVVFTPTKFMDYIEHITLKVDGNDYKIDIVPAPIMYYETDFAEGVFKYTLEGSELETKTDSLYSGGSSAFFKGLGLTITYVDFEFTGTGFDLISRCGVEDALFRCDIYSDPERTMRIKTISSSQKADTEFYQIMATNFRHQDYRTYYVRIGVDNSWTNNTGIPTLDMLNRGNQFYFDAIRIYNPINANEFSTGDELIAYNTYKNNGESDAIYITGASSNFQFITGESKDDFVISSRPVRGGETILSTSEELGTTGVLACKVPQNGKIQLAIHALNGPSTIRINRHDIPISHHAALFYDVSNYIENGYLVI